ncbi:MAG TPA: hypothetical protein PKC45_08400 [Gemmatales bacterium]|nr:hypothetical protein [Gemmatales bacterium]
MALQRRLTALDPNILLVRRPVLRRVARHLWPSDGVSWRALHTFAVQCRRSEMLAAVEPDEVGLAAAAQLGETVILLPRPDADRLSRQPASAIWHDCCRRLFHLRIEDRLAELGFPSDETSARVQKRRWEVGFPTFAGIERVLRQEARLRPPGQATDVYAEFVATFFEFLHFQPGALATWFPDLGDHAAVAELLRQDIDERPLLAGLTPAFSPSAAPLELGERPASEPELDLPVVETLRAARIERWLARAETARRCGNWVRAALLTQRCLQAEPDRGAIWARQVRTDLDTLVLGLVAALGLPRSQETDWLECLEPLVGPAARARGDWPAEARLLYDLQRIVLDTGKQVEVIEVIPWLRHLGRRALRRQLPLVPLVQVMNHLRRAQRRLKRVRVRSEVGTQLFDLLEAARLQHDGRMRDHLRPILLETFANAGLTPGNLPERLARDQCVEELLGTLCRRGYLNVGDLRDALARNELKMADLSGPREFWWGDALLRADRMLMDRLDGLYQPGAFYHRWFHRGSSIFFGTSLGRFATLWLLLPLLAAFVILEGLQHSAGLVLMALHLPVSFTHGWTVAGLAVYLLGLIHFPQVRQGSRRAFRAMVTGIHTLLVRVPVWLGRWGPLHALYASRPCRWVRQHLARAIASGTVAGVVAFALTLSALSTALVAAGACLLVVVLDHTPPGRKLSAWLTDQVLSLWRAFSLEMIPALLRFVLDLFKALVERIERGLYWVDEMLRFQPSAGKPTIVVKAAVGVVWYFVAYVFRFALNLLVEPQINPIKHFPVVTVAHKLLLPTIPHLAHVAERLLPGQAALANTFATGFVFAIPGIFGYLVWELKENWKLYGANRARTLRPAMIGSHGESMRRLLRPGFHSGTVPKAWSKLRHADKLQARGRSDGRHRVKALGQLHHVEDDLRHFSEHGLLAWLAASGAWSEPPLRLHGIQLAANGVRFVFNAGDQTELALCFVEQQGVVLITEEAGDWMTNLTDEQCEVWRRALAGFACRAGAEFCLWRRDEELVELIWPTAAGLEVWPPDGTEPAQRLPWECADEAAEAAARREGASAASLRLPPVAWSDWVAGWRS